MSTVTGMKRSDRWAKHALSMRGVESREVKGEADIKVLVDTLYFTNHGARSNYRPVLHVRGRLVGLVPYGSPEIAYGITEVDFDQMDGGATTVDAFYEFTDEQLVSLVEKGFFNEGFEPPSDLLNQVWMLPAHYEGVVIAPRNEQEAPLAFLDVIDRDGLVVDAVTSGLDLSDYFPDYLAQIRSRDRENEKLDERTLDRTNQVDDIFAGMESQFDDEGTDGRTNEAEGASIAQALSGESTVLPVMDSPLFDALMRNAQAAQQAQETEPEIEAESEIQSAPDVEAQPEVVDDVESQRATLTTDALASTFREVVADVINTSVAQNAPEILAQPEVDSIGDLHEAVADAERDTERKRLSAREAVEAEAPVATADEIDAADLDDPEF
nr:MAG TPA: hypothetical protein [Caudoviricetes sp.]